MNNSSVSYKSTISINTDDKKLKLKSKEIIPNNINIISSNLKKNLNNSLFSLKKITKKKADENSYKNTYEKIDSIIKQIENLFNNYINDIQDYYQKKYENILRYYEQKIRILYENKFSLELKMKILEESNYNLLRKEKEYDLIKAKTGIVVQNGKIINNSKKENEILILKKENSILKDTIEKQKVNFLTKEETIQQNNDDLNKKLIFHSKNNKNKKILPHHSHPKTHPFFLPDFISKLNNSVRNKSIISPKLLKNNSFTKNNTTENSILNKSSKKSNTIKNYINIKIRKLTKNFKNKNNSIKKLINKKHKSFNKNNTSENNNRNISELFHCKRMNLLFIRTVNNENNINKKIKSFRFLSPRNCNNIKHIHSMIPKSKNNLNEIKNSNSFNLNHINVNNSNLQNNNNLDSGKIKNKNITKILITKIDNKYKKRFLLINKRKKESNSKSKTNCSSYNNKSFVSSKGKDNNINFINNYIKKMKK